jgi:phage pi2 protein 07
MVKEITGRLFKEMMDFINKEFYQKFSGGSGL